jgi:ADP-heptose:LPS heptosyltransferase
MLSVSVAVHNPDLKMYEAFLKSLIKHTPSMSQLLIYDNASRDNACHDLTKKLTEGHKFSVHYVRSDKNNGFGFAHNYNLLARVTEPYFAVINDDIEFFEEWAEKMIEILRTRSNVMQVGMKRGVFDKIDVYAQALPSNGDDPDYIEASCMMMRTRDAVGAGLFDTNTYKFAYFEDTDLSLRLKKAGGEIAQVDCNWIHHRAQTSEKIDIDLRGYHVKNEHEFKKRWMSYLLKKKFGECIGVRRTGAVGDVLLTLPVLKILREENPDCTIVLATQAPQLVVNSPYVDAVVTQSHAPLPCTRFINLDDTYEADFTVNIVDGYARAAGVTVREKRLQLSASPQVVEKVKKLLDPFAGKRIVAMDLSDTWKEKQWAYENYIELAKRLRSCPDVKIALIGAGNYNKKEYIQADIDLVNQLNILETGVFLSGCSMYIGHEGLGAHMAQAADRVSVVLYGCTTPEFTNDVTSKTLHTVLSPALCGGCRHTYAAGNMVICPRNAECMKMITVDMVWEKVKQVCQ